MKKLSFILAVFLLASLVFVGCDDGVQLEYKVVLGEEHPKYENFYIVAEESYGDMDLLHVQYSNGIVLFTVRNYITGEVAVSTYDIHSGTRSEKLKMTVLSAFKYKTGFAEDGTIYIFDGASNALTFYDSALVEKQKLNFVNVSVEELYVGKEYVYCTSGGAVVRINLKNNAVEELAKFADFTPSSMRFIGKAEDEIFLIGYGYDLVDHLIVCDTKSGECYDKGSITGKLLYNDGIAANDTSNGESISVYDYSKPSVRTELQLSEEGEMLLGVGKGMICTTTHTGEDVLLTQTVNLYSLDKGKLIASCKYDYDLELFQSSIRNIFIVDGDFALFEVLEGTTSKIILWKYSEAEAKDIKGEILLANSAESKYEKDNDRVILEIAEKYGVNIVIGDAAARFYPDYVAVPENDGKAISAALFDVKAALEKFPDGFFAELGEKSYFDSLSIVICKDLVPSRQGSLAQASGYYTGYGDTQYVLLNSSADDIESTLSHELFHAAEEVMAAHSHTPFGDWKGLNPDGFEYKNSYVDENGQEYDYYTLMEYTPYDPKSLSDPDNIYFFDHYSQTFEKEDRARIFEMLMAKELSDDFETKNLGAKARHLYRCLDEFFECIDADTEWNAKRIMK